MRRLTSFPCAGDILAATLDEAPGTTGLLIVSGGNEIRIGALGMLALGPLLLGADLGWLADPRGLAVVLHLGLIATALAYVLFARGLRRVPVSAAATFSLAEPLTAALLGTFLLGERLSPPSIAGAVLLLVGLLILARCR